MSGKNPITIEQKLGNHVVRLNQEKSGAVIDITLRGEDGESVIIEAEEWKRLNKFIETSTDFIYNL